MPSWTKALVEFVLKQAVTPLARATELIDVGELAPELPFTLAREDAGPALEAVLKKIEGADLLVVGTSIAKGSYTGLLKHLFDLLRAVEAEERVAIIAATDPGATVTRGTTWRGDPCDFAESSKRYRAGGIASLNGFYGTTTTAGKAADFAGRH